MNAKQLNKILLSFVCLLQLTGKVATSQDALTMRCSNPPPGQREVDEVVQPMSDEEVARLHDAPHGARRVGKHQLEVAWGGGKRIFTDKPPYDDPFDGVLWAYCGFEDKLGLHLVLKHDRWLLTGVLLDDRIGSILPAGKTVLFAPDQKFYLAYEQQAGQDGETIKLYQRSGAPLWEGNSDILSADGKSVIAELEGMHWEALSNFKATVRLNDGKTMHLTLKRNTNGKWGWLPRIPR
jgi:hypothetical protein